MQTGELIGVGFGLCPVSIAPGSTTCPQDLSGADATATHHFYGFSCVYTLFIPTNFPGIKCDWDVVRSLKGFMSLHL